MGEEMEGAVQQAAQPDRQSIRLLREEPYFSGAGTAIV